MPKGVSFGNMVDAAVLSTLECILMTPTRKRNRTMGFALGCRTPFVAAMSFFAVSFFEIAAAEPSADAAKEKERDAIV